MKNIDFELLNEIFFKNVIIMIIFIAIDIIFTGDTTYALVFMPFFSTFFIYIREKESQEED